jgi:hypothetical protein
MSVNVDNKTKGYKNTKDSRDEIHEGHSMINVLENTRNEDILEERQVDLVV